MLIVGLTFAHRFTRTLMSILAMVTVRTTCSCHPESPEMLHAGPKRPQASHREMVADLRFSGTTDAVVGGWVS